MTFVFPNIEKAGKFAASVECLQAKSVSVSGWIRSSNPRPRALPLDPLRLFNAYNNQIKFDVWRIHKNCPLCPCPCPHFATGFRFLAPSMQKMFFPLSCFLGHSVCCRYDLGLYRWRHATNYRNTKRITFMTMSKIHDYSSLIFVCCTLFHKKIDCWSSWTLLMVMRLSPRLSMLCQDF